MVHNDLQEVLDYSNCYMYTADVCQVQAVYVIVRARSPGIYGNVNRSSPIGYRI